MFLFAGCFPLQFVTENASAWLQHMSPLYIARSLMLLALLAYSALLSGCHSVYGARVAITYVSAYQWYISRMHVFRAVLTGIPASVFFLRVCSVILHPYDQYTQIHVYPVCRPRYSAFENCRQEGALVCCRDVLTCWAGLCRRMIRAGSSSS